ncbi:MAG: hypothetical protein M0P16_05410 [Syntrophales bacterium]|jgi:hypothetical protein|nr:hypothetical protein [Syntrophales bacterium]MCK9390771.1 hypothetical protein [Syntrophales bacterium]
MGDKGQEAFIKEMQNRFDKKLREHEISVIEHWREQLTRILMMKPEGVGALQAQIKKMSDMMNNRIINMKKTQND